MAVVARQHKLPLRTLERWLQRYRQREYMPYSKWLGTAFSRLRIATRLEPALLDTLAATNFPSRERALSAAYEIVATEFNALGLCEPVPAVVSQFHGRPYRVIHGDQFAAALGDAGIEPSYFGNTSQWIDSTDALYPRYVRPFAALYATVVPTTH